ncbi:MAG: tetratricopeptide repeat protein [Planctomycetia bacterium]|nr:tetratricopeptide repeat protein [Planctomycetia bacterium]
MNCQCNRSPLLLEFYQRYLACGNVSLFVDEVSSRYAQGTLERLTRHQSANVRRAAVVALGLIGDYRANQTLADALVDPDETTAILADCAIRSVWKRDETLEDQKNLQACIDLNQAGESENAVLGATYLLQKTPGFAEVWFQRGRAWFDLGNFKAAKADFQKTLELNPHHFEASVMLGYAFMELGDAPQTLEAFRRALRMNPGLREARPKMRRIQRTLKNQYYSY